LADQLLDTSGLKCPLPVLKARKALKPMPVGAVLEVHATDPSSVEDFRSFCETTGHELLVSRQEGETYIYQLRKAG